MMKRQLAAMTMLTFGDSDDKVEKQVENLTAYMPSESYYGGEAKFVNRYQHHLDVCPDRLAYFLNYIESKGPNLEQVLAHIKTLSDKAKVLFGNKNVHKPLRLKFSYANQLHANYATGSQEHKRLKILNGLDQLNDPYTELAKLTYALKQLAIIQSSKEQNTEWQYTMDNCKFLSKLDSQFIVMCHSVTVHLAFLQTCRYAYNIRALRQWRPLVDALLVNNRLEIEYNDMRAAMQALGI